MARALTLQHRELPRADLRWRWLVSVLVLALPWLTPFASGPLPSVVPWLVAWSCAAIWVGWLLLTDDVHGFKQQAQQAWLIAAMASSAIALLQYFSIAEALAPWVNVSPAGEAFANLRQRNQFATLTTIAVAALAFRSTPVKPRGLWALAMSAMWVSIGTATSSSRTGALQFILIGLLAWMWRDISKRYPLFVFGSALSAFLLASWWLPHLAGLDPASTGLFARLREGDALCSSRLTLWSNVLHLIAQKPWLGWGWGELDYAHFITLYEGPRFCDILDNAHNLPLHLAVELGVPVAVAVCGLGTWLVLRLRPWRETMPERKLAWAVLALILLHSMLEYPLWYGPFQIAVALCVWMLWDTRAGLATQVTEVTQAAQESGEVAARARARPWVLAACATVLAAVAYAAWDYHRISQIYLAPERRSPAYRENTMEKLRASWLFRNQVLFAELTTTTTSPANAAHVHALALRLLHFSPEPRVVRRVIESAVMLGRDDEARFYLQRYRAAFPQDHAAWLQALRIPLAP